MTSIAIHAQVRPTLQLAWQQARRPWVERIELVCTGTAAVVGARLVVRCDPAVAEPVELGLPPLEPGKTVTLHSSDLPLVASTERLLAQQEREEGHLRLVVSADGVQLGVAVVPVSVLPANHWDGLSAGPELLAAFVRPNTVGTAQWLERAREVLLRRRLDPSFEGYQANTRERVLEMAAAIYAVPTAAGITYANPPAGFESRGQKIRLPDQIFTDGMATCLDLANAMAAALEQVGLHPLLVVQAEHAFAGVWLGPDHPSDAVMHDPAELRKRVDLGQCIVFDSSPACRGVPFEQAIAAGRTLLNDEAVFRCAIDVRSCRQVGIRPLPSRLDEAVEPTIRRGDVRDAAAVASEGPTLPPLPSRVLENLTTESRATRLDRWRGNLLDLTTRNRLLDLRDGKQMIPLLADNAAAVEDAVYARASLILRPRPSSDAATPDNIRRHATEAAANGELRADLTDSALNERAIELYRRATAAERDSGHSPLFLTIGLLRWYESPSSDVARHAPILLVPVQIVRDSVRGPYRIRRRDEDAELNPTLLRKLSGEFGIPVQGLEPVFEDNGVDVPLTLQNVRQAVLGQARFDVLPSAALAMLSFDRVLLYNDLQANLPAIQANPIVARLLDINAPPLPQPAAMAGPADVDRRPAREDFCIVDADSSQQAAVWSAVDGNSFVLQGPPGTGKSQTITNLVAQLLARQKTVLFVAEKRAALEVVHTRLKSAGLGPFVLDAHSDSDDVRVSVIHQLDEPGRYAWKAPDGGWEQHAVALEAAREELNAHVRRIHTPGPFGESLYEASGRVLELAGTPLIELQAPPAPTREQVVAMETAAARCASSATVVSPLPTHPLRAWDPPVWTPQLERDSAAATEAGRERLRELSAALAAAAPSLGVTPDTPAWAAWVDVLQAAAAGPPLSLPLLSAPQTELDTQLATVIPLLEQRAAAATVAEQALLPSVYAEPALPGVQARLARWATAFFLFAWFALFGTRRRLRPFARALPLPANRELRTSVDAAVAVQQLDAAIAGHHEPMRRLFGTAWRGHETSVDDLRHRAERRRRIRTGLAQAEATQQQRDALYSIAVESDERLARDTPEGARLHRLLGAAASWAQIRETLYALLVPRVPHPLGVSIDEQATALEALSLSMTRLRDWASWRNDARAAIEVGLAPVLGAAERGELDPGRVVAATRLAIRSRWIDARISSDPALGTFQGLRHNERIARFRELEQQTQHLARQHVQSLLAARLPDPHAPGPMEIIRREVRKKSRHIAVRRLFSELRDVVQLLKPCVLMSPLSVARYLDPSLPLFDVVIFDEASQIPPWDAVGALARARQAIVVGDSKQLPPTTFFRKDPGETSPDDEDVEDLESILDQCAVAGFRELSLGWHYRSRHESLIAFSNAAYYQNSLNIFPSPLHEHPSLGVKWRHIASGYYDRGGSRTNRAEADAVVAGILEHLRDPDQRRRSLGVVTFAMTQQELIENLLDQARRDDPGLDEAIAALPEPLFVKNLENVQGDERDVMYFSIGYAADANGKLPMNFGPLNRVGGERRLNVAVTRAKERLVVYSTLQPEQIDLSRTSAQGVRDLKAFLAYARDGRRALDTFASTQAGAQHESPFEAQVAARIAAAGYTTHAQVGVAGYRIDLAVVDPQQPGAYLLAVECDGAQYHSAASARDRDRLRQAVLERMGWNVHRIWSTDWWFDPNRQMEQLLARLRALETSRAAAPAAPPPPPAASSDTAPLPPARAPDDDTVAAWPADASPWPGLPVVQGGNRDFHDPAIQRALVSQLDVVCSRCAPLRLKMLTDHIAHAWDVKVVNRRVIDRVAALVPTTNKWRLHGEEVWPTAVVPNEWTTFRYAGDAADRDFDEVPLVERVNALVWIVSRSVFLNEADASRELARVFGVARLGAAVRRTAQEAVDAALSEGRLVRDGERLRRAG